MLVWLYEWHDDMLVFAISFRDCNSRVRKEQAVTFGHYHGAYALGESI